MADVQGASMVSAASSIDHLPWVPLASRLGFNLNGVEVDRLPPTRRMSDVYAVNNPISW